MSPRAASPKLTAESVALIKHFESCSLDAYRDPVGVPTIGFGHTRGVRLGTSITPAEAEEYLRQDLNDAQADVLRYVKVPLSDNEYGALVSLVFNIGGSAFYRSRCLALLNKGDRNGAAGEFQRFVKGRVGGRLTTLRGLCLRREAERALFCSIGQDFGDDVAEAPLESPGLPLVAAVPPILTRVILPPAAVARPRTLLSLEHLAAAAGMGTGLGAVPVLDSPDQSGLGQAFSLWQTTGAANILANVQNWSGEWLAKLSQLAQSDGAHALLAQTMSYFQSHTTFAVVLGATVVYMAHHTLLRLLRLL